MQKGQNSLDGCPTRFNLFSGQHPVRILAHMSPVQPKGISPLPPTQPRFVRSAGWMQPIISVSGRMVEALNLSTTYSQDLKLWSILERFGATALPGKLSITLHKKGIIDKDDPFLIMSLRGKLGFPKQ